MVPSFPAAAAANALVGAGPSLSVARSARVAMLPLSALFLFNYFQDSRALIQGELP